MSDAPPNLAAPTTVVSVSGGGSPIIPRLYILGARPISRSTAGLLHPSIPTTPLTPSTPGTPGSLTPSTPGSACSDRSSLGGYSWDPAAREPILPVRCKNTTGQLYKFKFGSGGRGKCIRVEDKWYTPSEFETLGGRGGSKDWKRSIRYGGRSIQSLIEEGYLQPHATSCTCNVCCDEETLAGPVRLFVPYKRRKNNEPETNNIINNNSSNKCGKQLFHSDSSSRSPPPSPKDDGRISPAASETDLDNLWSDLEEKVNSWIKQGQQMKKLVERVKHESRVARDAAFQQLKEQMEAEKKEAVEALMAQDDALNSLEPDKKCGNCNREARIKCSGCTQVFYCTEFCQNKDWVLHKDECQNTDEKSKVQIIIQDYDPSSEKSQNSEI